MSDEITNVIETFKEKAESIKDETERSKKYRAGIATLAQKAVVSKNTEYLEVCIRFTDNIIDSDDRSRAYVDIIRAFARIARNISDPELVQYGLRLSEKTDEGHDRSHALEGVVSAMADVGVGTNDPDAIQEAKRLACTIEYDTYRSSSLRSIARSLHSTEKDSDALILAARALEIIESSDSIARPIYRASALIDLARLFLVLDQIDTAIHCIEKAEESAHALVNEFDRSSLFQSIVETRLIMGARTRDRDHFERAVTAFDKITREYYRTFTLKKIKKNLDKF